MNLLDMAPEVVQMLESDISAFGMLTPDPLAALLSLLAPNQVLAIEVVVHDSRAAVCKGALFTRQSLITDAIRTLRSVQEQRESIRAGQRFVFYFERLGLYG
jgi:hypothetical protein